MDIKGRHRVSKYGVDVEGFEEFLKKIDFGSPVIVIDEIGKMESFSDYFTSLIRGLLKGEREKLIIAAIAEKGGGLIEEVKARPGAKTFHLRKGKGEELLKEVLAFM